MHCRPPLNSTTRKTSPSFPLKNALLIGLVVLGTGLAQTLHAAPPERDGAIASINGKPINKSSFLAYLGSRVPDGEGAHLNKQQLQGLLHEFINRELIYQDAVAHDISSKPQVKLAIANQAHNIIASFGIKSILGNTPSEEELNAVYQKHFAAPTKEYKTRHILVRDQKEALSLISKLNKGARFGQLAEKFSLDTSGSKGGVLDWFSSQQMVPAFRRAIEGIKPGTFTPMPVKTRFGWHIIKLEKTREIPAPLFEAVREEVVAAWQKETLSRYINKLRQKANIELK